LIKKGDGWRIGWKADAPVYKGLIGGKDWAFELSEAEMQDFIRLLSQIHQSIEDIHQYLIEEETITCEVESELIWLGAKGYPNHYSLRIILSQQRSCEGNWAENAISSLITATQTLTIF
jgi:Domain of unknown function (DUF1818)